MFSFALVIVFLFDMFNPSFVKCRFLMKVLASICMLSLPFGALAAPSINDVMQSHHIGKPVLSMGLGKPVSATALVQNFNVNGCPVEIEVDTSKAKKVISITAQNLEKCPGMKLEEYFGVGQAPLPARLTFGEFQTRMAGKDLHYWADCLTQCGNAYDPFIHASWLPEGKSGLMASAPIVSNVTMDAADKWRNVIEKKYGEDYVVGNQHNCSQEFNPAAKAYFKDVKVVSITIQQPDFVFACAAG